MNVADVMTRHVISVSPDATVENAAKLMLERGISGLMVVDANGELAGVVTEGICCGATNSAPNGTVRGGCACWSRRGGRRRISPARMAAGCAT